MIVFPEPSIPKCSVCEDGAEKKAILVEAEKRANEELAFFREKGDRRGEAMMLLCGAEAMLESRRIPEGRRGNKKRQEASGLALLEPALGDGRVTRWTLVTLEEDCV
ncbi:unnamed protein product [Symbiodinium sp. KB8]|nr:unnamed protein product [Symbiodinium sp. KB8]